MMWNAEAKFAYADNMIRIFVREQRAGVTVNVSSKDIVDCILCSSDQELPLHRFIYTNEPVIALARPSTQAVGASKEICLNAAVPMECDFLEEAPLQEEARPETIKLMKFDVQAKEMNLIEVKEDLQCLQSDLDMDKVVLD